MDPDVAADVAKRIELRRTTADASNGALPLPQLPEIPVGRYTDPDFFALEQREVFGRTWLLVGHESEWPEPGSFRAFDLPTGPIVVARNNDGGLAGFRNACRHRGAPVVRATEGVVRATEGVARRFTCQFHSWSYNLEGDLVGVPGEADFVGLCRAERRLAGVQVEVWSGLVFVNFDTDAAPLETFVDPIARRFDSFLTHPMRFVERRSFTVRANWKVVLEAFLEVYHLPTVHPTTAAPFALPGDTVFGLHPGGHSTMYMPYAAELTDADDGSPIRQAMFPPDLPTLAGLPPIFETTNVLFALFPNLVTPLSPQGFPVVQVWPVEPSETTLTVNWYGPDWGTGPRPGGWATKFAAWDLVLDEDMANLEPIQISLEAAAHRGIRLGAQEQAIWHLHAALDDAIGAARVPYALSVGDLLAPFVEQ